MQNAQFTGIIKSIRGIMPALGLIMVILVYLVSAYVGGSFLSELTKNVWLGYSIAIAIQCTRAVIVFFNQMNPQRPVFGYVGELCAIAFGLMAIIEMYNLTDHYSTPVFVSVALLMVAGIFIEVMLLREVKYATAQELVENPAMVTQIRNNAINQAQLKKHLQEVADAAATGKTIPQLNAAAPPTPTQQPTSLNITDIQKMIADSVSAALSGLPQLPQPEPAPEEKKKEKPLELNLNGSGNGVYS